MMNKQIISNFICVLMFAFTQITVNAQSNWVRTNPGGGGALSMVTGTSNGTIIAGSDLSGVYKSTNNGQSWTPIGIAQGLTETDIHSLAPHGNYGNTFYIGTGRGIFKAINGGQTVYKANMDAANGYVEAIEMCSVDIDKGYAALHEGWNKNLTLLKTIDGGDNWFKLTANNLPAQGSVLRMMAHPSNDNLVYALLGKGRNNCSPPWLYKSTDGGWNWTRVATGLGDILDFDLDPTNQQVVFASTFQSNGCGGQIYQYVGGNPNTGGLFRSTQGGVNFQPIGDHTGFINVRGNPNNIAVTNFLFASSNGSQMGTWKTSNGGNSWSKTGDLPNWDTGWPIRNYAYTRSFYGLSKTVTKDKFRSGNYYASYGGYAWTTSDGGDNFKNVATKRVGNGKHRSTGMDNINGNAIEVSDSDPNTIFVGYYDLGFWYTRDRGLSWKYSVPNNTTYVWGGRGGSNVNFIVNDPQRPNVVWATFGKTSKSTDGAIFKSTAYGENWQISNGGDLQGPGNTTHGMSIDLKSPVNNRTLYVTQNGDVYKSTNDGASWSRVSYVGGLKFTAVDRFNSQLVYAGGKNGFWRSTNGGNTWTQTGLNEMRNQQSGNTLDDITPTYAASPTKLWNGVFEIKADPNTPNRVYVTAYGAGKGAYKSNNGGVTWTKIYTDDYMRGIAIHPSIPNLLYISSSSAYHSGTNRSGSKGFLKSENGGQSWTAINSNMSWYFGGRMEIDKGPNPRLWAWSPGTGVQYTQVPAGGGTAEGCITIDNDFSDWSSIPASSNSNGYTIKTADDNDAFYIYINGNLGPNNQIFLDTDNNNSGGNEYTHPNWLQTGFNYMIQNNTIASYTGSGSNWSWSGQTPISVQKAGAQIEVKIDKSLVTTNTVNFGFVTRNASWAQIGFAPANSRGTHTFSNSLNCDDACISIDANFSDWSSVPTRSNSNGFTIKTTHDNDAFYIYVNGNLGPNNQFFLDTDNNNSGGNEYISNNWLQTGFNYMIQNNTIASYTGSGSNWSWSGQTPISVQKAGTQIEVKIDKSIITANTVNFGFVTRNASWAQIGFAPANSRGTHPLSDQFSCNAARVEDQPSSPAMNIYPNPTSDMINIDFQNISNEGILEIYDLTGKLLMTKDVISQADNLALQVNHLTQGVYIIRLKLDNGTYATERFVKLSSN